MKWKPPTPSTNTDRGHHAAGGKVSGGSELGGGQARSVGDREGLAGHVGERQVEEGHVQGGSSGDSGRGPPPTLGWDEKTAQAPQEDMF